MAPHTRDIVLGALVAGFFTVFLFWIIPAGIDVPAGVRGMALSPAFWPRIVAGVMIVLGMMLLAKGIAAARLYGARWPRGHAAAGAAAGDHLPPGVAWAKMAAGAVLLFVYTALVDLVGMTLASILAFIAFAALYGERRWLLLAAVGGGLALVLTWFFADVAHVPIPGGTLWES